MGRTSDYTGNSGRDQIDAKEPLNKSKLNQTCSEAPWVIAITVQSVCG